MQISDFDYELPEDLIAQQPLAERDASRMLIVDRAAQSWRDSSFNDVAGQSDRQGCVWFSTTHGFSRPAFADDGGRREAQSSCFCCVKWKTIPGEALTRPGRRLRTGAEIEFEDARLRAKVIGLA